jgi:hypothetical protein
VTADFPFDQVVLASCHNAENGDLLLPPNNFKSFCKCCNKEKDALSHLTKLEMQHNKKRKRNMLILVGKRLGCNSVIRALVVLSKWIFMRLLKELK